MDFNEVNHFWFDEIEPKARWVKDPEFDQLVRDRFLSTHQAAVAGELYEWRVSPRGRLAEIIVLDQFSRNMFRDQKRAFAFDSLALMLAQEGIRQGDDQKLSTSEKSFFYMPFMHSESAVIHEWAVQLFSQPGLEGTLEFEMKHKVIIDRFGRYPHRNEIVGRDSTAEEIEFLKGPNSSF